MAPKTSTTTQHDTASRRPRFAIGLAALSLAAAALAAGVVGLGAAKTDPGHDAALTRTSVTAGVTPGLPGGLTTNSLRGSSWG